jgi:hypothetical protein
MRRVPFQEPRPPKVKRSHAEKMKLQMAPANQEVKDYVKSRGLNPYLILTVKPRKTIEFLKNYLIGERRYNLPPNTKTTIQSNALNIEFNNDKTTLGEIYELLKNPEVFRLEYNFPDLVPNPTPEPNIVWTSEDENPLPPPDSMFFNNYNDDNNQSLLDDDWYNDLNNQKKRCKTCFVEAPLLSMYVCGGCKKTIYCSKECQKADWLNNHYKSKCSSPSSPPSSSSSGVGTQGTPLGIKTRGF